MLPTIITVCVYVIVLSTAIYFVVEIYQFVKSKLTREPEVETPQRTFSFFDLPDSEARSKTQQRT